MKISVLVPTYRRPDYLAKALGGLARQTRPADEVVVAVRRGDSETEAFLDSEAPGTLPVEAVRVSVPGVVAAMNAAAEAANGDTICLLDDDAEPFPDWIEKIEKRFAAEPRLGFLGGRDLLQDHPEMRRAERTVRQVGVFTWYGRILGNHHKGGGSYRRVDVLKGCNAAIRGHLLRMARFESRLRGDGAQVHWEVALALDVANAGFEVAYDPGLLVIHNIAPRYGSDQTHRGGFSAEALYDMVWNEHFVVGTRCAAGRRAAHLLWALAVGSLDAPGLLQFARNLARPGGRAVLRLRTAWRAIRDARRAAARER